MDAENSPFNRINTCDPIDMLCDKMKDLNATEMREARKLLENYRDLFTISSNDIGQTNVHSFDIDDSDKRPVTVPLRRVPLHHRDIVQQLINRYEELHLLEPVESPFRASTVLVAVEQKDDSPKHLLILFIHCFRFDT